MRGRDERLASGGWLGARWMVGRPGSRRAPYRPPPRGTGRRRSRPPAGDTGRQPAPRQPAGSTAPRTRHFTPVKPARPRPPLSVADYRWGHGLAGSQPNTGGQRQPALCHNQRLGLATGRARGTEHKQIYGWSSRPKGARDRAKREAGGHQPPATHQPQKPSAPHPAAKSRPASPAASPPRTAARTHPPLHPAGRAFRASPRRSPPASRRARAECPAPPRWAVEEIERRPHAPFRPVIGRGHHRMRREQQDMRPKVHRRHHPARRHRRQLRERRRHQALLPLARLRVARRLRPPAAAPGRPSPRAAPPPAPRRQPRSAPRPPPSPIGAPRPPLPATASAMTKAHAGTASAVGHARAADLQQFHRQRHHEERRVDPPGGVFSPPRFSRTAVAASATSGGTSTASG
jgi:hypothetical protein